jgi:hypothetical protein
VQETLDGIAELRNADLPVGRVIVNLVRQSPLEPATRDAFGATGIDTDAVDAALHKVGIDATPDLVRALLAEGSDHLARLSLQDDQRAVLRAIDPGAVELPLLSEGVDLGALDDLASALAEQGMT